MVRTSIKASVLALSVAALFSSLPITSAEAQYYHRRSHAGEALAGGIIGGAIGGLAAGAIINANRPVYHAPVYAEPVYVAPDYVENTGPYLQKRPVYWARPRLARAPEMEVVPNCYMSRQRIWLDRYTYTHRYTRICD